MHHEPSKKKKQITDHTKVWQLCICSMVALPPTAAVRSLYIYTVIIDNYSCSEFIDFFELFLSVAEWFYNIHPKQRGEKTNKNLLLGFLKSAQGQNDTHRVENVKKKDPFIHHDCM